MPITTNSGATVQGQQTNEAPHPFATIGAETGRGDWVSKTSTHTGYRGLTLAHVGDIVTYEDGAGAVAAWGDKPLGLIGSRLSNGDRIANGLRDHFGITVHADKPVAGLIDAAYALPEQHHA